MNEDGAREWWQARRGSYNRGLMAAGIMAFAAYLAAGSWLLPDESGFEMTIFTILLQSLGLLAMIAVANIFHSLGFLSEVLVRPADRERYRRICHRLGFWFSVAVLASVPLLLVIQALFFPDPAPPP